MQEADNKNSQSESTKETEEDKSSEISKKLPTEAVTDNNTEGRTTDGNVDVDLTKLSSTMVFSEVYR